MRTREASGWNSLISLPNAETAKSIHLNNKHSGDELLYTHGGKNGFHAFRTISISVELFANDQGYPGTPAKRHVIQGLSFFPVFKTTFLHFVAEEQCQFPKKGKIGL